MTGILNLLVPGQLVETGMGYGMLFVIGLRMLGIIPWHAKFHVFIQPWDCSAYDGTWFNGHFTGQKQTGMRKMRTGDSRKERRQKMESGS